LPPWTCATHFTEPALAVAAASDGSEADVASRVKMSWSATDAGLAMMKPLKESVAGAMAAAADGAVVAVGRGRSVVRWVKEAVRQPVAFDGAAPESEGRDVDEDASDTAAAAAEDEVETVEEEEDAVEPSLLLLPSLSPAAAVPVAMQSRGRSFMRSGWSEMRWSCWMDRSASIGVYLYARARAGAGSRGGTGNRTAVGGIATRASRTGTARTWPVRLYSL
jgi:hypothetical protein